MGSKSKKTTVGYSYSWDFQSGLGRGPVDELVAIMVDDKTVLATTPGQITANTEIYIDKPDLFGGTDVSGEGGIQGWLEVAMGEADQTPSPRLTGLLSGLVPGFRGMVTTFFSGLVSAFSASPKPWKFRVRRAVKGWDGPVWYPEKAVIVLHNTVSTLIDSGGLTAGQEENLRTIHAMNPAHILVQAATDRSWGRGLSLNDDLDLEAYRVMADTLYDEGFGLCFRYNRQDTLDTFIQQILDHIGAVQYGDLNTGKLTAKLIREDYDADSLPLFDYDSGILGVQDDDDSSADNTPNELIVTWHDPCTDENGEVRVQNLGAIQSVGLISQAVEYPALPTHDLAARVAQRDLEVGAAGLTRLVLKLDRRGGILTPASVFRVSLPDRNIDSMVMRVGDIKEQSDGSLSVTAIQDVFSLPATRYSSGQQGGLWVAPDKTARPVTQQRLVEVPYVTLAATLSPAEIAALSDDACSVGIMAVAPSSLSVNYRIQSRTGSASYTARGMGDWTPGGTLLADMDRGALTLRYAAERVTLTVGDALMVDSEILRIDAIDAAAGILTVGRGCADTVPDRHDAGAMLWFYDSWLETDGLEYLPGETVSVRLLTRTSTAMLSEALATPQSLMLEQRQGRPYPPGNVRVNGIATDILADPTAFTLTWSHRDRLLQGNNLVAHAEGDVGPEAGVMYRLRLAVAGGGTRTVMTPLTTWTYPDADAPAGEVIGQVRLDAMREELESWQGYVFNRG